jgi:competence protein ComEC
VPSGTVHDRHQTSAETVSPPRPLAWLAGAAAVGAALGTLASAGTEPARSDAAASLLPATSTHLAPAVLASLAVLAAVGVATAAWIAGWSAAGGPARLGAARSAAVSRGPGVEGGLPGPRMRPSLGLLLALAAATCARAAAAADVDPLCGEWQPASALHGSETGSLSALGGDLVELGVGWAREGERVRVLASAERTRPARGPVDQGRAARSVWTPRADEVLRLVPSRHGAGPFARARAALLAACDRAGGRESGPLLRALVCGDTSRFDADELDLFTRTGTRHLLAVSGQHVTWISVFALRPLANLIGALLARLAPRRAARVREAVFLALVLVYVPLAGGASPVRRAAVAFALAVAAGELTHRERGGRRVDVLSLWCAALLGELLASPRSIGEVALLLSYAATLGLLLGAAPLARCFAAARRFELEETWLRALTRRIRAACALALGASLAAVLATTPISWCTFGELSLPGAWITVVAVPLFALLLFGAWLWISIPALPLAAPWVEAARALVAWFEFADRWPATPLVLPPRPWPLVAVASSLVFAAWSARGRSKRELAAAAAAALWAALLLPWTAEPRDLEVVACDVGHGTAVLLRAPGAGAWVFDAGSRDRTRVAQSAVVPALAAWDIAELGIVASHGDRDHMSALPWIGERFRARVWAGALAPGGLGPSDAPRVAVDVETGWLRLPTRGPLELALVRGARGAGNPGSRSLRVTLGQRALLLCGDAEGPALAAASRERAFEGPLELLLAPHHGSDPDGLGELLERTSPREVWISSAAPAPIERELARRAVTVRETWRDGVLRLGADGRPP